MSGYGLDEHYAKILTGLLIDIAEGKDAHLSDGVQQVVGRTPRTFADFVAATWR